MPKLKVFTKADCPKCPAAKQLSQEIQKEGKMKVEHFDVDQAEGLAEAQFYSVMATPSLIVCKDDTDEEEIKSWRGEAPTSKEDIYSEIKG
ncbi:MAG: thioredoxin family protein [Candidatus Moraniibacteriota bacterium]